MTKTSIRNLQFAALPYRRRAAGDIEVMLITSRDTGRWVIPKGWPVAALDPCDSAAREAKEESGLVGRIGRRPLGRYSYDKRLDDGSALSCTVEVFGLEVEKQLRTWPERDERRTRWFSPQEAADAVQEPDLAAIFRKLRKLVA
ncbi:MAG: NUDIX hydrolase [Xanthobacteraceae bacterium]